MAFAAALSTPRIRAAPLRTHHPFHCCCPGKLEFKHPQSGSTLISSSPSSVPIRAEEFRTSSSASGSRGDVTMSRRRAVVQVVVSGAGGILATGGPACCAALESSAPADAAGVVGGALGVAESSKSKPKFYDLGGSGGVKALDIREGTGATPKVGDKVAIHYYARLAAKQGWRFDSSYDHKDQSGTPEPYLFIVGDGTVIAGLDSAVRTMKEGGIRRVVIPPSQGYQNTLQGPIPPNFSDRQRLYTTIFNPTRLANGEGSTLGILVFDIELLRIRSN